MRRSRVFQRSSLNTAIREEVLGTPKVSHRCVARKGALVGAVAGVEAGVAVAVGLCIHVSGNGKQAHKWEEPAACKLALLKGLTATLEPQQCLGDTCGKANGGSLGLF